jgi:acyl-CoA synthetase (NDP forming)
LASFLPADASTRNPVDMIASARANEYRRTLEELIRGDACDAILAIFVSALGASPDEIGDAIRSVAEEPSEVAIAAVFMTEERPPSTLRSERTRVPGYEFPEDAARAIALTARHGRWRARPEATATARGIDQPERAAAIISQQLADGPEWMTPERVDALLAIHGLPLATARDGGQPDGDAVELVVGVVTDVNFGPVLALAAGGDTADLVKDVAIRITPLSEPDAREMIRSLKSFPLLDGYRGRPRADLAAIEDVLLRVSAMVEEHPAIVELDLSPLLVSETGAVIKAARVRVESPPPAVPMPSLRA